MDLVQFLLLASVVVNITLLLFCFSLQSEAFKLISEKYEASARLLEDKHQQANRFLAYLKKVSGQFANLPEPHRDIAYSGLVKFVKEDLN